MNTMLQDEQIRLRALEMADAASLYEWENMSNYWPSSGTLAPYSHRNIMRYIDEYEANPFKTGELRLVIERVADGQAVGLIDLYNVEVRHRRACVGILVSPLMQRQGYAFAALRLMEVYCRQHLALHQLLAAVPSDNIASLRLFDKAGYRSIAHLCDYVAGRHEGEYLDATVFSLIL